jgi:hypothetical protein
MANMKQAEAFSNFQMMLPVEQLQVIGVDHRVADMVDPALADGSCELVSLTVQQSGWLGDDAELVVLEPEEGNWWHVAVAVPSPVSDDLIIHDYTAAQFDPDLPFPWVVHEDVWADTVEQFAGEGRLRLVPYR